MNACSRQAELNSPWSGATCLSCTRRAINRRGSCSDLRRARDALLNEDVRSRPAVILHFRRRGRVDGVCRNHKHRINGRLRDAQAVQVVGDDAGCVRRRSGDVLCAHAACVLLRFAQHCARAVCLLRPGVIEGINSSVGRFDDTTVGTLLLLASSISRSVCHDDRRQVDPDADLSRGGRDGDTREASDRRDHDRREEDGCANDNLVGDRTCRR